MAASSLQTIAAQEATPAACAATSEADNQAVVQRWYDILDAGDIDAFPTVLAPVIVQHAADFADAQGVAEVQANFGPFLAAFPDLHHEIQAWVTDGEFVAIRVVGYGTHQDDFAGVPATGAAVSWNVLTIYRIACGRIAEQWSEVDAIGRLEQLGAIADLPLAQEEPVAPAATPAAACQTTTEADNAALVTRWFDEAWSRHEFGALEEILAADHVLHPVLRQAAAGADEREALLRDWTAAFPDLVVTPEFMLTDGDLVVARWTATGTHLGSWAGFEPTGATVTWTGNSMFRIACGRIAEEWSEADGLAFFRQIGAAQWPPATPASS